MKKPLYIRIINYSLIVSVFFWALIAISVIISLKYSIGVLLWSAATVLMLISLVGIWKFDSYYYKVILVIMTVILGLNMAFGKGAGPEIVPILLAFYLWTKNPESRIQNSA